MIVTLIDNTQYKLVKGTGLFFNNNGEAVIFANKRSYLIHRDNIKSIEI